MARGGRERAGNRPGMAGWSGAPCRPPAGPLAARRAGLRAGRRPRPRAGIPALAQSKLALKRVRYRKADGKKGGKDWPKLCSAIQSFVFSILLFFYFTLNHHAAFTLKVLKRPISILPMMWRNLKLMIRKYCNLSTTEDDKLYAEGH